MHNFFLHKNILIFRRFFNSANRFYMYMSNQNENPNNGSKKISWVSIVNAVVQALIAALTALGVSSCANFV